MTRLEANKQIVDKLTTLIESNPHLRFSQILVNFGFVKRNDLTIDLKALDWTDEFYVESEEILSRINEK